MGTSKTLLAAITLIEIARAGALTTGALEQCVQREMRGHRLPGVSVALREGDRIVWSKSYGSTSAAVNTQTLPELFVDLDAKLEKSAEVSHYIPGFDRKNHLGRPVTVDDLLHGRVADAAALLRSVIGKLAGARDFPKSATALDLVRIPAVGDREASSEGGAAVLLVRPEYSFTVAVATSDGSAAQSVRRIAQEAMRALAGTRKPPPAPSDWMALIGEYGSTPAAVIVRESDGKLTALFDGTMEYPIDVGMVTREGVRLGGSIYPRRPDPALPGATFRIQPVRPVSELRAEVRNLQPPKEGGDFLAPDLKELVTLDDSIRLDIRYATSNNFMGEPFYAQARAFLQRPAADALVRAHRWLRSQGYGLLIHDAYRPWSVTKMFWDATPPDKQDFVANPAKGSRHNRGCAVDLTLYDLQNGAPIKMTGGYDEMSERSYPDYPGGTSLQRWHRDLLRRAMEQEGFTVFEVEWWHFDYQAWRKYPILNLPFEQLGLATVKAAAH